jgi:hypothetical protein
MASGVLSQKLLLLSNSEPSLSMPPPKFWAELPDRVLPLTGFAHLFGAKQTWARWAVPQLAYAAVLANKCAKPR